MKSLFSSRKSRVLLVYIIDSFDQKLTLNKNKKALVLRTFRGSSARYNYQILADIWQIDTN